MKEPKPPIGGQVTFLIDDEEKLKRMVLCDSLYSECWDFIYNTESFVMNYLRGEVGGEEAEKLIADGAYYDGMLAAARALRTALLDEGINFEILWR